MPTKGRSSLVVKAINMQIKARRGGLILYRTVVAGAALDGNSVLDIGEPVRDYAQARACLLAAPLSGGCSTAAQYSLHPLESGHACMQHC